MLSSGSGPWPQGVLVLVIALGASGCATGRARLRLAAGEPRAALVLARGNSAEAFIVRALAYRALGDLPRAITAARFASSMDPRSAAAHRLRGWLEAAAHRPGAALRAFSRSLVLDAHQPRLRRAVARLYLRRARLRGDPLLGLAQGRAAKDDLRRAKALDPSIAAAGSPASGKAAGPKRAAPRDCPGFHPSPLGPPPASRARCTVLRPQRYLDRARDRRLLLACDGGRLGRFFERRGCLRPAFLAYRALHRETPDDPRWLGEMARIQLGLGHQKRAELMLSDFVYYSRSRATAQLQAARLLLAAGKAKAAGHRATLAFGLAEDVGSAIAAASLLIDAGYARQAEEAGAGLLELRDLDAGARVRINRLLSRARDRQRPRR